MQSTEEGPSSMKKGPREINDSQSPNQSLLDMQYFSARGIPNNLGF